MTMSYQVVLGWLLTYALHSSALLVGAMLLSRRVVGASARDVIWKTALVGGIISATGQTMLSIRPAGSLALSTPTVVPASRANVTARSARDEAQRDAAAQSPGAAERAAPPAGTTFSTPSFTTVIVIAWMVIGGMLAVAYMARRLILVGRLGDRRPVTEPPLVPLLDALIEGSSVRSVHLTSSNAISSPVALGMREICVPAAAITELDEQQQRGLLAHELAHLERNDPSWLDAASLLERVFFFQPLNRVARREMQLAAEYLCDESAAARLGTGVPLAKCLARVAEWIQASPLGVPVAGMAEQRSQLVERIARLVNAKTSPAPIARPVMVAGAVVMLLVVIGAAPGVHPSIVAADRTLLGVPGVQGGEPAPADAGHEQDPAVITALIERLSDSDARVRRAAASSLGNLRARKAVPALMTTLDDKDRDVVEAAAEALGSIRDSRAVNKLVDLLRDGSPKVRNAALGALEDFEREELPAGPFTTLLRDPNAEIRHRAAGILGNIHDKATVGALGAAAHDQSADVREAVIRALGEIGEPSAAPFVTPALSDPVPDVRHAALETIRELKVTADRGTVLALLGDSSDDVRGAAVDYLREVPIPGAAAALIKLLDDPSPDIRVSALEALAELRDPAVAGALKSALTSKDPKVRARAAEMLGDRRP